MAYRLPGPVIAAALAVALLAVALPVVWSGSVAASGTFFVDATAECGIDFLHQNGATGEG